MKENVDTNEKFKFKDITPDSMFKKIISLDANKGCMKDDIPAKLLLGTNDIVCKHLRMTSLTQQKKQSKLCFGNTVDIRHIWL